MGTDTGSLIFAYMWLLGKFRFFVHPTVLDRKAHELDMWCYAGLRMSVAGWTMDIALSHHLAEPQYSFLDQLP